jgi:CHAD domain-containing protein
MVGGIKSESRAASSRNGGRYRSESAIKFARRELQRRLRKAEDKLDRLGKLDAKHRHKLRIALKKLRYATGHFEGLFDGPKARRKAFKKALKALQSSLGKLNDIRVHGKLAHDYDDSGRSTAPKAFAMGVIVGEEGALEKDLLAEAKAAAEKLAALKPFWN